MRKWNGKAVIAQVMLKFRSAINVRHKILATHDVSTMRGRNDRIQPVNLVFSL